MWSTPQRREALSPDPVVEGAAQLVALVPETHKLIPIGIGIFPSILEPTRGSCHDDPGGGTSPTSMGVIPSI